MGYRLGVDLGTTFTAAAVERDGRAEVVPLGDHAPQIPSVVFVREDGHLLVGEPAVRRGVAQPDRVAREFKRQLGDDVPRLLGGEAFPVERLTAALLRWVVDTVVERQGARPERLALTHPANWGSHRMAALGEAVRLAEVGVVTTVSEPAAAAVHFASTERARAGDVLLVYDLGGGTFDTAVLRCIDRGRTDREFELLGRPEGIAQLGGVDFDDGVFRHVLRGLGDAAADLDPDDPAVTAALARLRRECTAAKEALSTDSETVVDVVLPSATATVRITRPEFEDMVRPAVEQTLGCLHRALASAGVSRDDLSTVVLVGGSARIPLVAEVLGRELGRPVAVSPQPKHAVALGAALLAGGAIPPSPASTPPPAPPPTDQPEPATRSTRSTRPPRPTTPTQPARPPVAPTSVRRSDTRRPVLVLAGFVVAALLLAFVVPLPLWPSPGSPAGLLADGADIGTAPVLSRTLDQPVVLSTTNGAVATVTAWLGPVPLADAEWPAGGAGVLDLRAFDRFLGGPLPVTATVGDAPPVRFVVDPPAFPAASFWLPAGVALFVFAYVESLLRPIRKRRRVRSADVAAFTALGAIAGVGLAVASWAMAGNVVPTWLALAIVAVGAGTGPAAALLLRATVHKRQGP